MRVPTGDIKCTGGVIARVVELEYGHLSQQATSGLRANLSRVIYLSILSIVLLFAGAVSTANADVPRAYAGIVVDAKTGNTLYSYAADSTRYPASVVKVMTLYVLFQELEAGRMSLSTRLNVSNHAAAAVPSKLYLRAGSTIKVEDAIKALVTKSANDVARVIAENISGTEGKFAERMTRTARALGMSRTTYANASGLPSTRQVTTVRDQARLGMAVFQHFPQYYHYFQTRSFTYNGNTYGNHNRLLGQSGVDGIKTGYTRASGYNLLTAARRDNRHVIVVGFGFSSGAARNAKVAELLSKYMRRGRSGSYWRQASIPEVGISGSNNVFAVADNQPVIPMPRPAGRDIIEPTHTLTPLDTNILVASQDTAEQPIPLIQPAPPILGRETRETPIQLASIEPPTELIPTPATQATAIIAGGTNPGAPAPIDVIGAWISENFRLGPRSGDQLQPSGGAILLPPASIGSDGQQAIDLMTSGSIGLPNTQENSPVSTADASAWVVQIGAPPSAAGAERMLSNATGQIAALTDFRSYVEQFEKTGQIFFRARFAGFTGREQAVSMCEQLRQENMSCLAVQS